MSVGFHTELYPGSDTQISFGLLMSALLGSATQTRTAHGPAVQNTEAKTPWSQRVKTLPTLDRCTTEQVRISRTLWKLRAVFFSCPVLRVETLHILVR